MVQKGRGKFVDLGQRQNGFLPPFPKQLFASDPFPSSSEFAYFKVMEFLFFLKGSGVGKAVFAAALLHQWSPSSF
jgi:hypothetical protein